MSTLKSQENENPFEIFCLRLVKMDQYVYAEVTTCTFIPRYTCQNVEQKVQDTAAKPKYH